MPIFTMNPRRSTAMAVGADGVNRQLWEQAISNTQRGAGPGAVGSVCLDVGGDDDNLSYRLVRYCVGTAFDISQMDGKPLPHKMNLFLYRAEFYPVIYGCILS